MDAVGPPVHEPVGEQAGETALRLVGLGPSGEQPGDVDGEAAGVRGAHEVEQDAAALQPDLRGALASIEMDWIKLRQQELAGLGLADQASRLEYQNLSLRLRELMRGLPRL